MCFDKPFTEKERDDMRAAIGLRADGAASVAEVQKWFCVKCGRDFKHPKIPATCETLFSICMTCFAISCTDLPEEESVDNG